jgi:hypothetical protein
MRLRPLQDGSTVPQISLNICYTSFLTAPAYFTSVLFACGLVVTTYISDEGFGLLDVGQRRWQDRE